MTRALAEIDAYFVALAEAEGLPPGIPQDYDRDYFRHQMPGGMMTTFMRQLDETDRLHLLPEVLEETVRVRAELGYPIMVTPFSQVVGTQALMNVIDGERYKTIPDQVIRYAVGRFSKPMMPLDPEVEDRILSSKRRADLEAEPHMAPVDELRARIGKHYSDEEFLLRAVMPAELVDAMVAAGARAPPLRPGHEARHRADPRARSARRPRLGQDLQTRVRARAQPELVSRRATSLRISSAHSTVLARPTQIAH